MAVKIDSSVAIAQPVEEVLPFLLDVEKATQADPSVEPVVKTPEAPLEWGPRSAASTPPATVRLLGRRPESIMVYTRIEPNREFEFDADLGPLAAHVRTTVEQVQRGNRWSDAGWPASLISPRILLGGSPPTLGLVGQAA